MIPQLLYTALHLFALFFILVQAYVDYRIYRRHTDGPVNRGAGWYDEGIDLEIKYKASLTRSYLFLAAEITNFALLYLGGFYGVLID